MTATCSPENMVLKTYAVINSNNLTYSCQFPEVSRLEQEKKDHNCSAPGFTEADPVELHRIQPVQTLQDLLVLEEAFNVIPNIL